MEINHPVPPPCQLKRGVWEKSKWRIAILTWSPMQPAQHLNTCTFHLDLFSILEYHVNLWLLCPNFEHIVFFPQSSMNLPPDKARLLRQYDSEKKWDLICDQVLVLHCHVLISVSKFCLLKIWNQVSFSGSVSQERFQVKNPPHTYIEKLRGYLASGVAGKVRFGCVIFTWWDWLCFLSSHVFFHNSPCM